MALCFPGVGNSKYLLMAKPLYSILVKLLPDHPIVTECRKGLSGFQHDGYKLLMSVMKRALPAFNSSIPMFPPRWEDIKNASEMAQLWLLYFRYQDKLGTWYSPIDRSKLYLNSLREHSMLGLVASLQGSIESFRTGVDLRDDEIELPHHLTIDGILETLLTATSSPLDTSITFASSHATRALPPSDDSFDFGLTIPNIQGAIHATASGAPANRCGRRKPAQSHRSDNDNGLRCRACRKKNHEEVDCRELAKLLILSDRLKSLTPALKKKVVESYTKFYGEAPSPAMHSTSCAKLEEFCNSRGISESELEAAFHWENYCLAADLEDIDSESSGQETSE